MGLLFEEIDVQQTSLGALSLRRRRIPALGDKDIYEVKLGEEYLMSSLFVDAEVALSTLGLAATQGENLKVVVGGLGLGHTALAALDEKRVGELLVIEALEPVIRWHREGKVPLGSKLSGDPRCRYIHASFFDLATDPEHGFDPDHPGQQFDAILLDIDHSPSAHLNSANASFYTEEKLGLMAGQLCPGGVFAMWSNEPPDATFSALLETVFGKVESEEVAFYNPFQNREAKNTVYIAKLIGP